MPGFDKVQVEMGVHAHTHTKFLMAHALLQHDSQAKSYLVCNML